MLKEHFCDMLCNVPRKLWLYGNTGQNIPILERKGLGGIFSLTFPSKPYVSRGFFRKVRHVEPAQSHLPSCAPAMSRSFPFLAPE